MRDPSGDRRVFVWPGEPARPSKSSRSAASAADYAERVAGLVVEDSTGHCAREVSV
jgi:hypothetical protein